MRLFAVLLCLIPIPAFAHWGHLPELAGHSHWIGMAAAAAAAWGIRENSKDSLKDEESVEENEEELQEA